MKRKLFASISLSALLGIGLFAGLANKPAQEVKADSETWLASAYFDAGDTIDWEGVEEDSYFVHVWGDGGYDVMHEMHRMCRDWTVNIFMVTFPMTDAQNVNGAQFIINQGEFKYSNDLAVELRKDGYTTFMSSYVTWEQGAQKWTANTVTRGNEPYGWMNGTYFSFVQDVDKRSYVVKNKEVPANAGFELRMTPTNSSEYTSPVVRTTSTGYVNMTANNQFVIRQAGTYDFYFYNIFERGTLEIKKHEDNTQGYIYYVTQSSSATNDYIYSYSTYNDVKGFGNWPGTKISEIEGVEALFADSQDFKFNHSNYLDNGGYSMNRVVYKIPVTVGYPNNPNMLILNNGSDLQTDDLEIWSGSAYIWKNGVGRVNAYDGQALDFILEAEQYRKSASNSSVCNMSVEDAYDLYGMYLALMEDAKAIVDQCEVYTWTDKTYTAKANFSYAKVMEKVGIISGRIVPNSLKLGNFSSENSATIVVVIIASIGAVIAGGLYVMTRKKKEN